MPKLKPARNISRYFPPCPSPKVPFHSRPYPKPTSPTPSPQSRPRSHATSPTSKPTPRHLHKKMPPLAGTHAAQKLLLRTHLRGLTSPPHPHVNAVRLIPKDALAGIKPNGDCFMKQSRLRLENGAEIFECGNFDLWGCSPHKTKPPHSKTSAPVSQTFQAVFSKENGRVCARPLKEVLCKKAVIPAFPRRTSWAFPDKRVFALLRWHRPSC